MKTKKLIVLHLIQISVVATFQELAEAVRKMNSGCGFRMMELHIRMRVTRHGFTSASKVYPRESSSRSHLKIWIIKPNYMDKG